VQAVSDFRESCVPKGSGYFTYFENHGVAEAAGVNGKGYDSCAYGILSLTLGTGSYSWDYKLVTGGSGDSGSDTCH